MASTMLGRAACPECGFAAAHVKISEKEGAKAYRHCPDCGAQYFPRNQAQADKLREKIKAAPADIPAPAPTPAPTPAPAAPAHKIVLGVRVAA